ncbi:hypothetical protein BTJ68_04164 [Hortaea werneckii EXF-2000]|uniref:SnoaL-like domain-containing protein n=1 Tax=Hortaea werneckii EXF-2000 TaxID=1157616 RepID=A0A1Z5TJ26_HORWE|nr:hypothetical protein BTJ68_04164 [Hortaea werneckii EXF-2000]
MAPTKTEIETLCSHLGTSDPSPFFDRVSPDVVWDVMGTYTLPSSHLYYSTWTRKNPTLHLSHWLTYPPHRHFPSGDHPAAGHFTSLEAWKQGALGTINQILREPLALKVVNVVGGGRDQEWALVELEANAVCKNGMPYPQRYAWVMRFDETGIIVQVRAYLDSALVQKAVDSNS